MAMMGTTICAVKRNGKIAIAGDGQVTMGENTIFKNSAKKVRRIYNDQVVTGFAGSVADAFSLCERFEERLTQYNGNLERAAVSLAQDWRGDKAMRQLQAMMIVANKDSMLIISGTGEVIDPDDGICAIGSGGNYALAAARALVENTELSAAETPKRRCMWRPLSACLPTTISLWKKYKGVRAMPVKEMTPREIVRELDRYIIGQDEAKRAVAIALRNRYRRSRVSEEMREEIYPKNILMIGPTGVGKTEIARRLAKLVQAPFVKVEATKFTEVGYVGRDVESIIRDLVENAVRMVQQEHEARVHTRAEVLAEDRLLNLMVYPQKKPSNNPFQMLLAPQNQQNTISDEEKQRLSSRRDEVREQLRRGELEDTEIEIEVAEKTPELEVGGNSINLGDMMGGLMPPKTKQRRVKVKEARRILIAEEAEKLIDQDAVQEEAIRRAEQNGIVFLDEIDKIAGRSAGGHGPDVSREGVQRDILPIVEGSTVSTKYGPVKTDFMLFIAAGAFHVAKVTDLIPELQGRFPVHVQLKSLTREDFVNILSKPDNALTRQYAALLETDKVHLTFEEDARRPLPRLPAWPMRRGRILARAGCTRCLRSCWRISPSMLAATKCRMCI